MGEFLAFLWFAGTLVGGAFRAIDAGKQIDDAIAELNTKIGEYQQQITDVIGEGTRKTAQADRLIAEATASAVAAGAFEISEEERLAKGKTKIHDLAVARFIKRLADLEAAKVIVDTKRVKLIGEAKTRHGLDAGRLAQELADIDTNLGLDIAEIDRKIGVLVDNKDAAIAKNEQDMIDLLAEKEETFGQLQLKAELEDEEAVRKVALIEKYRDENLKATRDDAVLMLNEAGAQGHFDVGQATVKEQLVRATAEAQASAGGIRRAGTPLMALKQTIKAAQEEVDRAAAAADYTLNVGASRLTAKLSEYRSRAQGDIEGVQAANILFDSNLDMLTQTAEREFEKRATGLDFTRQDILRQYQQDYDAYEATKTRLSSAAQQLKTLKQGEIAREQFEYETVQAGFEQDRIESELTYTQARAGIEGPGGEMPTEQTEYDLWIAGMRANAKENIRLIDEARIKTVGGLEQNKEDITANVSLLTAQYATAVSDLTTEVNTLGSTRAAKQFTAAFGTGDILASATNLLTKYPSIFAPESLPSVPLGIQVPGISRWGEF